MTADAPERRRRARRRVLSSALTAVATAIGDAGFGSWMPSDMLGAVGAILHRTIPALGTT
jgi:hypothetical protein